jgi:hypothetical protein
MRVMVLREPGELISSSHGQRAVVLELQGLQHRYRVQDEGDALLVVGDGEAIGALAVDTERLVFQHAGQVDGVHVGDQHDLPVAGALEFGVHHGARLGRCVFHPVDVGRLDDLDLAAEPGQAFADQRRQPGQPLGVLAAGFDVYEVTQRVQQRSFFLLRQLVDAALRCSPRGHGRQGEGAGSDTGQGKMQREPDGTRHGGPFK